MNIYLLLITFMVGFVGNVGAQEKGVDGAKVKKVDKYLEMLIKAPKDYKVLPNLYKAAKALPKSQEDLKCRSIAICYLVAKGSGDRKLSRTADRKIKPYLLKNFRGSPYVDMIGNVQDVCPVCGGEGKISVKCPDCKGTGDCPNKRCDGGQVPNGRSAVKPCPFCKGTGECKRCGGTGEATIKCTKCKGSGQVFSKEICNAFFEQLLMDYKQTKDGASEKQMAIERKKAEAIAQAEKAREERLAAEQRAEVEAMREKQLAAEEAEKAAKRIATEKEPEDKVKGEADDEVVAKRYKGPSDAQKIVFYLIVLCLLIFGIRDIVITARR